MGSDVKNLNRRQFLKVTAGTALAAVALPTNKVPNMETPKTQAGALTERIMLRIKATVPNMPVEQYNRAYSAVHEELESEISKNTRLGQHALRESIRAANRVIAGSR